MKAKKLLKTKNIKDTLFRDGNWITGGLSELMTEFAEQQNKELIKTAKLEASLRKSAETRCMKKSKEEIDQLKSQNEEMHDHILQLTTRLQTMEERELKTNKK